MRRGLHRLILPLLLVVAACTSELGAVRDFSRLSAGTAEYRGLVDRYLGLGDRLAFYRERPVDVGDRAAQRDGLLALQSILADYMTALGDLAEDRVVTVSTQPLAEAAGRMALFDPAMQRPAQALGDVLARAATAGWRQRELTRAIEAGNAPVQDITARLIRFAEAQGDDDRLERLAIEQAYGRALANPRTDPAARRLIFERRAERLAELDGRAGTRAAFVAAMRKVADGHQLLHDRRDRLSAEETLRQLRPITAELRTLGRALRAELF